MCLFAASAPPLSPLGAPPVPQHGQLSQQQADPQLPTYQSIFSVASPAATSRTPSQMSMQDYNNTKNGMHRRTPQ